MEPIEDKITIIEGPPPIFETFNEEWLMGLSDSSSLADLVMTRLRTFNGPALVERCHKAWQLKLPMYLVYRNMDGLEEKALILATRALETDEGQMLLLWVRRPNAEIDLEIGYDDEDDETGLNL